MTPRITRYSIWPEEHPELCKPTTEPCGEARIVQCDGDDWDIAECSKCGKQYKTRCTFDEDYS
jgi:hypothetical protein